MSIPVVIWLLIAVALASVYTYRRIVVGGSDELVHLSDVSDAVIEKQEATARTVQQLDRVVMILTILFVVYRSCAWRPADLLRVQLKFAGRIVSLKNPAEGLCHLRLRQATRQPVKRTFCSAPARSG